MNICFLWAQEENCCHSENIGYLKAINVTPWILNRKLVNNFLHLHLFNRFNWPFLRICTFLLHVSDTNLKFYTMYNCNSNQFGNVFIAMYTLNIFSFSCSFHLSLSISSNHIYSTILFVQSFQFFSLHFIFCFHLRQVIKSEKWKTHNETSFSFGLCRGHRRWIHCLFPCMFSIFYRKEWTQMKWIF